MNKGILLVLGLIFFNSVFAQQFLDKTLTHDGETREYKIYIPANYDGVTPFPLMFNFHGGGGNIDEQIYIADMRTIADSAGFLLVYPQALPDPNDGGTHLWTHKPPTTVDDIFFVEAMINEIAGEYTIDQDRVYACGYSNGGEFTFELACRLSDHIAAIGVVARSMYIETYNNCSPTHPTAVMTIHGTEDFYEGIVWGGETYYVSLDDANDYWVNFNNITSEATSILLPDISSTDGSTVEQYTWEEGDGCVGVQHLKVIDGGHDWPGSFGNMDINASLEIWKFVSKYNKNGLINCSTTTSSNSINNMPTVSMSPNPVTDFFVVKNIEYEKSDYVLCDSKGEIIKTIMPVSKEEKVEMGGLPNGVYFIKINKKTYKILKAN